MNDRQKHQKYDLRHIQTKSFSLIHPYHKPLAPSLPFLLAASPLFLQIHACDPLCVSINKPLIMRISCDIYKMLQSCHQMAKVEAKSLTRPKQEPNHTLDAYTGHQHEQPKIRKNRERAQEYDTYQIDHKTLPFIFRFNYPALQRLRMKQSPHIPKLAYDIFDYLKDKLVVRRYSEGGKYPNRMKYEEKVKFLMRAFDHRRGSSVVAEEPKRKEKFNRQKQLEFFTRPEVREHFLEEINDALVRKRAENERRIREIQDCIEMALGFLNSDPEKAERVFDQRIKRKQLPWTDNMFQDIQEFSKQLFYRFSAENLQAERAAIARFQQSRGDKKEEDQGCSGDSSTDRPSKQEE